jgi:hypothetical protein
MDISDEFTFSIDVTVPEGQGFPVGAVTVNSTIKMLLDIVRPAHTLFRVRYIFQDQYLGPILDTVKSDLSSYYYDDFRSYWQGLRNVDRLGKKKNQVVVGESHGADF